MYMFKLRNASILIIIMWNVNLVAMMVAIKIGCNETWMKS
jgi:hypothetical protein